MPDHTYYMHSGFYTASPTYRKNVYLLAKNHNKDFIEEILFFLWRTREDTQSNTRAQWDSIGGQTAAKLTVNANTIEEVDSIVSFIVEICKEKYVKVIIRGTYD